MSGYILRRLLGMIPTLMIISVIVFVVIQLPPGDIVTSSLDQLTANGLDLSDERVQNLRAQYNLDKSLPEQYLSWIANARTNTARRDITCVCLSLDVIGDAIIVGVKIEMIENSITIRINTIIWCRIDVILILSCYFCQVDVVATCIDDSGQGQGFALANG